MVKEFIIIKLTFIQQDLHLPSIMMDQNSINFNSKKKNKSFGIFQNYSKFVEPITALWYEKNFDPKMLKIW